MQITGITDWSAILKDLLLSSSPAPAPSAGITGVYY